MIAALLLPVGWKFSAVAHTHRRRAAVDDHGNAYIAAGQVFVYNRIGELIDTIDIPDPPSQLLFGGSDGSTLFILARSSLYAVQTRHKGR